MPATVVPVQPTIPVKFSLGRVVATPGALSVLRERAVPARELLRRHAAGDWGCLTEEDQAANAAAIAHEGDPDLQRRVLSCYVLHDRTKVWVITEHDRSATTLLLPEEY